MRKSIKGDLAKTLLAEGRETKDVMALTGLSYSTVRHHAETIGMNKAKRIDWPGVQAAFDAGKTYAEVKAEFGVTTSNIRTARQRGYINVANAYDHKRLTNSERIARLEDSVINIGVQLNWLRLQNAEVGQ